MVKKGSVTVFLALMLSLLLSLVCASIESVRMAAARTQILGSLDIGLYSLFGQYDRELLKEYDLFFLDGSCGGGTLKMSRIYDNMEEYMKPVLKQNSQKLSISQGGFTGYRLATDEEGEVFYHQVVTYMKKTLGSQGVQLLLNKMRDREEQTREAEQRGQQAEQGNSIESYENEMQSAAQKSQDAKEEAEKNASGEGEHLESQPPGEHTEGTTEKVVNPISVIKRIRKMGILELVLPPGKGASEKTVERGGLASQRTLQRGMPLFGSLEKDNSYASGILYQQYLMDKLGNYQKPSLAGLSYQVEYILGGKNSDLENLKSVARKLLLIREGVNFAHLLSDPVKRAEAEALALAIASGFLIPPAAAIIEGALLLCWAFGESILDVRELFDGGKVALVKSQGDWQLSLENLPRLLEGLDTVRRGNEKGLSYEDYLQVLLLTKGKEEKLKRGMDMVELCIRAKGRPNFLLDSCIVAIEASVDVKANKRKTFTVTKQYCYG